MSKDKLVALLRGEGFDCSASTVGRILRRPKERGVLRKPVSKHISARKRQRQHPYAMRKPREYVARVPGDAVKIDTLDVTPYPE